MIQDKRECFLCGRWTSLDIHHIYGGPWRKRADEDGLTCYLCRDCHRRVHQDWETNLRIKKVGQFIYEQEHSREEFINRYGKNYIEGYAPEGAEDLGQRKKMAQAKGADDQRANSAHVRGWSRRTHAESEANVLSDYYPKSSRLPKEIYNHVLTTVRSYDYMKEAADSLIIMSHEGGEPGGAISDPVLQAAIRRERLLDSIDAIDRALAVIPEEYRSVVFRNIKDKRPFKTFPEYDYAHLQTWKYWRRRFMEQVAINKGWWWK